MSDKVKFIDFDLIFYDEKGKIHKASKELKEILKQTIFKGWFQ
jgi:hypothetical protein